MQAEQQGAAAPSDAECDALWREATTSRGDTTQVFVRWALREAVARWGAPRARAQLTPPAVAPTDAMVDSYLRAQRETVEAVDRKFGHPNGKAPSHLHPVREACRAGLAAALAVAPPAVVEPLTDSLWQQHHRDSQELRRLCAERDQARRERDAVKAELAGLEASCSTLGGLVDELRPDSERLEWVLRRVSGSWLGAYLGAVSDTGDMDTLRTLIDANRGALGIKKGDSHG